MLELNKICKSYGNQSVLKSVSLTLNKGEMISIMGRSGSGKSTLLSVMAGLQAPDEGDVSFSGTSLKDLNQERLAEFRLANLGFIFQDFQLIPSLSVYDNVKIGIYPRKYIEKAEKHRRIEHYIDKVGLGDKARKRIDKLSGGERQRVAIARSLVNQPKLVLADEPTGNLDASTAEDIMTLFGHLHEESATSFVIITHDAHIANKTKRVYHLVEGALQ